MAVIFSTDFASGCSDFNGGGVGFCISVPRQGIGGSVPALSCCYTAVNKNPFGNLSEGAIRWQMKCRVDGTPSGDGDFNILFADIVGMNGGPPGSGTIGSVCVQADGALFVTIYGFPDPDVPSTHASSAPGVVPFDGILHAYQFTSTITGATSVDVELAIDNVSVLTASLSNPTGGGIPIGALNKADLRTYIPPNAPGDNAMTAFCEYIVDDDASITDYLPGLALPLILHVCEPFPLDITGDCDATTLALESSSGEFPASPVVFVRGPSGTGRPTILTNDNTNIVVQLSAMSTGTYCAVVVPALP